MFNLSTTKTRQYEEWPTCLNYSWVMVDTRLHLQICGKIPVGLHNTWIRDLLIHRHCNYVRQVSGDGSCRDNAAALLNFGNAYCLPLEDCKSRRTPKKDGGLPKGSLNWPWQFWLLIYTTSWGINLDSMLLITLRSGSQRWNKHTRKRRPRWIGSWETFRGSPDGGSSCYLTDDDALLDHELSSNSVDTSIAFASIEAPLLDLLTSTSHDTSVPKPTDCQTLINQSQWPLTNVNALPNFWVVDCAQNQILMYFTSHPRDP